MSEFHNCNFKVGDIIIGINPRNKFSYLRVFIIKDFETHDDYGREVVDYVRVDYVTDNEICTDIHSNYEIGVSFLNRDFRRIVIEEV